MTELVEKYLELATILRDPNTNTNDKVMEDAIDAMDALWEKMTFFEKREAEKLVKTL